MAYAGLSDAHATNSLAVNTTNGAGPHNIQMFFLSADGTVLHCLPGYWNPDDLVGEMALADQLNSVWLNPKLSRATKDAMFTQMQIAHTREHSPEMAARSHLQTFDQSFELSHATTSDFVIGSRPTNCSVTGWGMSTGQLKTTDVVLHERMAVRPFLAFQNFDVAVFSNYGTQQYDKNEFNTGERVARMQERDNRDPDMMDTRWGDPRQAEMIARRQEQLSQQIDREKVQLNRQFDPTEVKPIRPHMAAVQSYTWNAAQQSSPTTANSSMDSLITNYRNTYQRTVEAQQNKPGGMASNSGFVGPASKASGLENPQVTAEQTRMRDTRYVRTYGNYPSARVQPANATAFSTPTYTNATSSKGVYQAPVNYQMNKAANQTVSPAQVTTVVRGTVVNRPVNLSQGSLQPQQE
jgi:hypothetical protein